MAELVARSKSGDRAAFGEIYDLTFDDVYRYALALSRNQAEAEDITADTYERALKLIDRYEWRDKPILAWLIRIAQNVAREHFRRIRTRPTTPLTDGDDVACTSATDAFHTLNDVQERLATLTPAQREVIALRLAGFKIREVAQMVGKAEGTVKALQFAGTARLREVSDVQH
jgi:RNA polymerase sigma-70 factor (ECF subfamily)